MKNCKGGFSLVELLVSLAIFTFFVVIGLVYLSTQMKVGTRESAKVRVIQEDFVSELILIRDVSMAGLGFPVIHGGEFIPLKLDPDSGVNNSDVLYVRGSIISSGAYDYIKWGYTKSSISDQGGAYKVEVSIKSEDPGVSYSSDPDLINLFTLKFKGGRDDYSHPFETGDKIIFLNADTKDLLSDNIYTITSVDKDSITFIPPSGKSLDFQIMEKKKALVFCVGGINKDTFSELVKDDHFTGYKLSTTVPDRCAPNTRSLVRVYGSSMAVMDCILDFQVRFGFVNSDGNIVWEDDPTSHSADYLEDNLKVVRVYIVRQYGSKDGSYTYPNDKITTANNTINLSSDQRHYRWQTIKLDIPIRILNE